MPVDTWVGKTVTIFKDVVNLIILFWHPTASESDPNDIEGWQWGVISPDNLIKLRAKYDILVPTQDEINSFKLWLATIASNPITLADINDGAEPWLTNYVPAPNDSDDDDSNIGFDDDEPNEAWYEAQGKEMLIQAQKKADEDAEMVGKWKATLQDE